MEINRLRWAGHVVRRQPDDLIYKVWQSTFMDGKRNRSRSKNSWTEAIEADFQGSNLCRDKNIFHSKNLSF